MKVTFKAEIVQELTIDVPDYSSETEAFNAAHDIFVDDLDGRQSITNITNSIKVSRISPWYGPLRPRFKVRCVGKGRYGPWTDCWNPLPDDVAQYFKDHPNAEEQVFRGFEYRRVAPPPCYPTAETKKQLDKILLSSDNG